jgi:hypothetical protein
MPSDPRASAALAALAKPRDQYRSAVAATLEDVRVYLDTHRAAAEDRLAVLATELGTVGAEHIDIARFSTLLTAEPAVDQGTHDVLQRALAVLAELAQVSDEAFVVTLEPGANLYERVAARLADFGRAMGAARVVDSARSGRYRPAEHDRWLRAFPFGLWSPAERAVAPPIVVEVDGADLRPAGLAEFLDGSVKIVLVARGETSPAPLVRLVTPRTFVAQAADDAAVSRLADWDGPGVVGLLPEGTARFSHSPSAGDGLAARLTVGDMPALDGRKRAGPFSRAQQLEELEQLKALQAAATAAPAAPVGSAEIAESADPADKLAAWLLQQTDLAGV